MTTPEQNDFLAQTGPDTPMGRLVRRYWIPALLSSEIAEPDCPPVRVKLLGERLIAFRDSLGRIGVMDELCAHRGVSLWFGRNEENGLRCPYHGWKYDVTGQCVEVPSEPVESGFCKKIKLAAYECIERGDVIWIYMGPPDHKPAPPNFEWATIPPTHRFVSKRTQECNWLQALEGGIDSVHVSFLHRHDLRSDPLHISKGAEFTRETDARFEVIETRGGMVIGVRRPATAHQLYWRLTQWVMPFHTMIPPTATTRSTATLLCRSTTRTAWCGASPIIQRDGFRHMSSTRCAGAAAFMSSFWRIHSGRSSTKTTTI